jgi:hypothetical protein
VLHEEERMSENPHSLTLRDEALDAIVEKLRERADTQRLAHQVAELVRALRECEALSLDADPEFGQDRPRILLGERLAAFRMREPGMKSIDPIWRERVATYWEGEGRFKAAGEDMVKWGEQRTRDAWAPHILQVWRDVYRQVDPPPDSLINEVVTARGYPGMSLRLAYKVWGSPNQDLEDFREKLQRIAARMGPNDHLFP